MTPLLPVSLNRKSPRGGHAQSPQAAGRFDCRSPRAGSLRVLLALSVISLASVAAAPASDPRDGLRHDHPRLLATSDDWTRLRQRASGDPDLSAVNTSLLAAARRVLPEPPLRRELIGRRMLGVSRQLVERLLLLGYAWQMSGDRAFAQRAEAEMRAAAAFSDWNPAHFLDVAEATTALALGYDWCYDALAPEARAAISRAIAEKGLRPGLDSSAPHNAWHLTFNNWNQVCFAGLTLGALALADEEPALARDVLALARTHIGRGLEPYRPDGVYPEGPSYWAYGTSYQALMIASLESALGTDWDLTASPGLFASAGAVLQTTGPSGKFYNFADGAEHRPITPVLFWFARKLGDPGLLLFERRDLAAWQDHPDVDLPNYLLPLAVVWWPQNTGTAGSPALPLRWLGRGVNPIAVFRESWTDPASLYLALKGGAASLNHAHMDAGSFVLESDGVRWAVELGAQDYESLESKQVDLWNRTQESQRWQVYRLNNQSHNTLTIGGRPHRVDGHATITHFSSDAAMPYAIVDITPVFGDQAMGVHRGFRVLPDRRVLIEDELTGVAPGASIRWQMVTRADVTLEGDRATLRQDGRVLRAALLSAIPARFEVVPAVPPADGINAPNPGVRVLSATFIAPANGAVRFGIVLAAGTPGIPAPELTPLADWTKAEDRVPSL